MFSSPHSSKADLPVSRAARGAMHVTQRAATTYHEIAVVV
jgi:hypothetical protein